MSNLSLLGSTSRVETPFVKVTIGEYTFGVLEKDDLQKIRNSKGVQVQQLVKFPNYIKQLQVKKINGQVNQYELQLVYPISDKDDPNFFEKIFSSVSTSRKIVFTYGDLATPTYIFRNEEALITKIKQSVDVQSSVITYNISAVSAAALALSGVSYYPKRKAKASSIIYELLYESSEGRGLLEVFPGMRDRALVEQYGLIPQDDAEVEIEAQAHMSVLDYLSYLVSCMSRKVSNNLKKDSMYTIQIVDDSSDMYLPDGSIYTFDGPYFKITAVDVLKDSAQTYTIDYGIMSKDIITSFSIENDETYSLFYNYNEELNTYEYKHILNDRGEFEEVYAPAISSNNEYFITTSKDKDWWSKVTQFPISATLEIKGLLRPAILMTHVRLNIYFYGKKHINSGLYVVTSQTDTLNLSGYKTVLTLKRISGDDLSSIII